MSPTCVLLGMPPRAITAQFSNSKGGMVAQLLLRPRQVAHHKALAAQPAALVLAQFANIAQPLRHHAAGGRRDVDPDPLPVQVLRRHQRRPAAAKRIQNNVVRRCDEALMMRSSSCKRLLCRIAETLLGLRIDRRISSKRSAPDGLPVVEISLVTAGIRAGCWTETSFPSRNASFILFRASPVPSLVWPRAIPRHMRHRPSADLLMHQIVQLIMPSIRAVDAYIAGSGFQCSLDRMDVMRLKVVSPPPRKEKNRVVIVRNLKRPVPCRYVLRRSR